MSITNIFRITISPHRLHSASSVQLPHTTYNFRTVRSSVMIRPLNLFSAASIDFNGAGNTNMFNKNLRVPLSPIESPILRKYTYLFHKKEVEASVAQLDAPSDWRQGGRGFNPRQGRQHYFVEIDHEIFSTVTLSLPLIHEGQLSVSGEKMCTILVNRLED